MTADSSAAKSTINRNGLHVRHLKTKIKLFLMALPFIAFIFIFGYFPLHGWIYAFFKELPGTPIKDMHFAGLDLFKRMFIPGSTFLNSLRNTLVMSLINLATSPLPMIFALFLAEIRNAKVARVIQTVASLPNFISWVLVFGIFFSFFSSQGVINDWLVNLHIIKEPLNVLGNADIVWWLQPLVVSNWKTVGWGAIIYMAALSGLSKEVYDAAEVDGAGRFGKMWYVSLPGLMPTFIVLLVIQIGYILNIGFEQFYVFRNPTVIPKIDTLDVYIYVQGIQHMEINYAIAVGMARSLVSISLLLIVNNIAKKVNGKPIF